MIIPEAFDLIYYLFFYVDFSRQGFSVYLWLSWNSVDQAGLELTEIHLPLPPCMLGLKVCITAAQFDFDL